MRRPVKLPSSIALSVVAAITASVAIGWAALGLLRDMAAEAARIETLSEMVDKTRALHIQAASLRDGSAHDGERRQIKNLLASLQRLLDGVPARSAREQLLVEQLRRGYRELGPLAEQ